MAKFAKVHNIESIKAFRITLLNFADKATNSLGEAEAEVQRVSQWLEGEQSVFWASEVRKRQEAVVKAKEAVRFKQIFKSPTGGKQSTVDEEKALAVATRRLAEAEHKMAAVKKWIRQLHKEAHLYRGSVQRLATTVSVDLANAASKIARMVTALEGYVALNAPVTEMPVESGNASGVSRGDAGPDLAAGPKALRQGTPGPSIKDSATAGDLTAQPWTSGEFAAGDAEALEKLPAERVPLDPGSSVIVAAGASTAPRIYLERSAAAFPNDSGWYIGPADGATPASFVSARVADLLTARPHFVDLLSWPVGTLVVIDGAGISALLNSADEDNWAR